MIVLGLTGSIGMGKSTAAAMLRRLGLPVHDADRTVHALLARGGKAVPAIALQFPAAIEDGAVDRRRLGAAVFGDKPALARLEAILHPLVRAEEGKFLARQRRARRAMVVLDIPLLLESGAAHRVDRVIVVSCTAFLKERRVMARPGMTREKFADIKKSQMDDGRKRRLADLVVPTGAGRRFTFRRLRREIGRLQELVATKSLKTHYDASASGKKIDA